MLYVFGEELKKRDIPENVQMKGEKKLVAEKAF